MKNKDLLAQARLYYHEFGLSIFPVKLTPKNDKKAKKIPLVSWSRLQNKRPTENEIETWFNEDDEANGVGIVTGETNNLFVLDVDDQQSYKALKDMGMIENGTPIVKTGNGYHIYFQYPEGKDISSGARIRGEFEDLKLDFRCDGGYAVAPPSKYPTKNRTSSYEWLQLYDPNALKPPPDQIIKAIKESSTSGKNGKKNLGEILKGVEEGSRNTSATKVAGSLLGKNLDEGLAWLTLKTWNQERNDPPLEESELRETFENIVEREKRKRGEVEIIQASSLEAQEPEWLWEPYLERGCINVLSGDPGIGKTWIGLKIASVISREGGLEKDFAEGQSKILTQLNDFKETEPESVIYMSNEDDWEKTLKHRLEYFDYDGNNIYFTKLKDPSDGKFHSLQNVELIKQTIKIAQNPALIIVDPMQSFLGKGTKMNEMSDIQAVLNPINDIAQEYNTTFLLIAHLRKSGATKAFYRVHGSVQNIAQPRSVLMVEDPEDEEENIKLFVHAKSTNGPEGEGPSLKFKLEDGFQWVGTSPVTKKDLAGKEKPKTKTQKVKEKLQELLTLGPMPAKEIKKKVQEIVGCSEDTVFKASKRLNSLEKKKVGQKGWYWYLKDNEPESWDDFL